MNRQFPGLLRWYPSSEVDLGARASARILCVCPQLGVRCGLKSALRVRFRVQKGAVSLG